MNDAPRSIQVGEHTYFRADLVEKLLSDLHTRLDHAVLVALELIGEAKEKEQPDE